MATRAYTFVFGERLTPYHTQSLYKDRVLRDDMDLIQVLDLIETELKLMAQQTTVSIKPDADSTISQIYDVIRRIKEAPNNRDLIIEFRQYLETLAFLGYNLYLFRMEEIKTDDLPEGIEAYLYDTNDDLVSDVSTIATAWVMLYENKENANLSNVVMQFYNDIVGVNNFSASVMNLAGLKDKFNKLNEIGDGYMFDVSGLLGFLEGSGYKVQIIM